MGNEKSNSYWEAELPPNYARVGNENFIRAKYDFGVTSTKLQNSPNPSCLFFYHCLHLMMFLYRYVEKRWVPRVGQTISHSRENQQKTSASRPRPGDSGGHSYTNDVEHTSHKKIVLPPATNGSTQNIHPPKRNNTIQNSHPPNTNGSIPASKSDTPVGSKLSEAEQVRSCSFGFFVLIFFFFCFLLPLSLHY